MPKVVLSASCPLLSTNVDNRHTLEIEVRHEMLLHTDPGHAQIANFVSSKVKIRVALRLPFWVFWRNPASVSENPVTLFRIRPRIR